jgi:creatinine amidohydrolase
VKNWLAVAVLVLGCTQAFSQSTKSSRTSTRPIQKRFALNLAPDGKNMLSMTFPEFESEVANTKVVLLPIGSIEEHGAYLPISSDAILGVAELQDVQELLSAHGIRTVIGPPLNIGITNEARDWSRDGTSMYPGSLTVSADAFANIYLDVLRSLKNNGMERVYLVSGHLGGRHLETVARIAEEAEGKIPGLKVFAVIDSERLEELKLQPSAAVLPIKSGLNFAMLTGLLGVGDEPSVTVHADGWETSLMLHYYPELVRPGFQKAPHAISSRFIEASDTGDRSKDPSGVGGFPTAKASAAIGQQIAEYRVGRISEAIESSLRAGSNGVALAH